MKKIFTKRSLNKVTFLLALCWISIGISSVSYGAGVFTNSYRIPNGGTFSGTTTYCQGAASSNCFNFTTCTSGGILGLAAATGNYTVYYQTAAQFASNPCDIAFATLFSGPTGFSNTALAGSVCYTPSTAFAPGTYHYFIRVTTGMATAGACVAFPQIWCSQAITILSPTITPIIGGPATLCAGGATVTLSNATAGGTWTSSVPAVASVVSGSGLVTSGIAGTTGTTVITYATLCGTATTTITVNATPAVIVGTTTICSGGVTTLSDATPGGTWTSSVPAVAVITPGPGAGGGVVTGGVVATGASATTVITYATACGSRTTTVTVNGPPGPISGTLSLCSGGITTTLSDAANGTWTSGTSSVASINPTTGLVTSGVLGTSGTTLITYSNGCGSSTATFTVVAGPNPISGVANLCSGGAVTTLSSTTVGGTWTSGTSAVATVVTTASGGVVTSGVIPIGTTATSLISYSNGCGIAATITVTVVAAPGTITGNRSICAGTTTTLSDVSNGTWTSSNSSVATVNPATGVVSGSSGGSSLSTTTITYSNGCGSSVTTVSVIANPGVITGFTGVCTGSTITLSNPITGGTWISSNSTVATVTPGPGAGGGVVSGGTLPGTSTITYSNGCGSPVYTVSVSTAPTIISGPAIICLGATTTLSNNGAPTGTWTSSNSSVATIDPVTGFVVSSGVTGTTTITATNLCGNTTLLFTVSSPTPISGTLTFCQTACTTLSNGVPGGTWTSGDPSIATTTGTNIFCGTGSGVPAGCTPITYTLSTGCFVTANLCTTPAPLAITGIFSVCEQGVTCLTDMTPGGTWTSITTTVATVDPGTGCVTGVVAGTSIISYSMATCASTTTVTVNPLPGPILGPTAVCVNATVTLSNALTPGFWSSSNSGVATIDPSSGVVSGVSPGTTTITWSTVYGCLATRTFTVNAIPTTILGNTSICAGQCTSLSDATLGGTWSSSTIFVATVTPGPGAGGGIVCSNVSSAGGTTTITYTLPVTGCFTTTVVTVNPLPGPIVGPTAMCTGTTATLTGTPGGGTWSSSNSASATINTTTGVVTAGSQTVTTTTGITYTLGTGCTTTLTITVNPTPPAITGVSAICAGLTTMLSNSLSGGTWSSGAPIIASVTPSGGGVLVTGGAVILTSTAVVTYTRAGCSAMLTMTVNPLPGPILGPSAVCVGSTIALTDATPGGVFSSSNPVIAPIGSTTGILTGNAPGGTALITYSLTATGCIATTSVIVNPLPTTILGNTTICAGLTTTLSNATPFGTWSSSVSSVATVGSSSGVVTGGTSGSPGGTTTITYTLATGCFTTTVVTVNPLPAPIIGVTTICSGMTTQLSSSPGGGIWSSATSSVASVSSTGFVTGGPVVFPTLPQTAQITYSLTPTGCIRTTTVTVNPLPTLISGNTTICSGLTTTLSNGASGVWSSNDPSVASVIPPGGPSTTMVITGGSVLTQRTATITLTAGAGCTQSIVITVNPLPSPISGITTICSGLTTMLSNSTPGGTWSSSLTNVATVTPPGGPSPTTVVTGSVLISPSLTQTTRITYTLPTGCIMTVTVTVNPLPAAITGPSSVCEGATINLSAGTGGGAWSTSNSTVATVVPAAGLGVVTGGSTSGALTAQDTITYTLGTGCLTTKTITVNIQPAPIVGGPLSICNHSCASLSDITGGGVWTSGNTTIATVDATGLVCGSMPGAGIGGGTTNITYSIASCRSVTSVFINVQPVAITGIPTVCSGSTTILSNATPGGVWSTSNSTVATIVPGPTGGTVTGGGYPGGTATITYTIGTCTAMTTVTVNVQPGPITGVTSFCNLSCSTLSNAITGGAWTTTNSSIATVDPSSGVVCGGGVGSTNITYTMSPGGCYSVRNVTINVQPGTILGNLEVCVGLSTPLSNSTPGGTWSVSTSSVSIATVSSTGVVTGLSAGTGGADAYAVVTYCVASCCISTTVTVHPLPSPMTGTFFVCLGSCTTLGDLTPGGTWTSGTPTIATIGVVSGIACGGGLGTTMITYTLPTGCIATHTLTVIAVPSPIAGSFTVCAGMTTQLSDATGGGVWTSSDPATATIDPVTGLAGGVTSGAVVITYTLGSGCRVVTPLVVHPLSPITGLTTVCFGQTINLSDTTVGGTWSSANPLVASVNPVTGVVTGTAAGGGSTVISYTLPTGCAATITITVLPLPAVITGNMIVCDGGTTILSNSTLGGIWSSSNPTVASIDPSTGDVTAGPSGITTQTLVIITYTGSCSRTATLTVNPLPANITGNTNICFGLSETLSDATPGGTWSSSNPAIAPVGMLTGIVLGNGVGSATITYTLGTGCFVTIPVTVNPLPPAIVGITTVCQGSTTQLSNAVPGGAWFSSDPAIATINFVTGLVTGMAGGSVTITYQIVTGCIITTVVTVNPLPTAISGSSNVCVNSTTPLFSAPGGGVWSSINMSVATIDPVSGVVTGVSAGTSLISYTIGTGCAATRVMTVDPLPDTIRGITTVCSGMTTQLSSASPGGVWSSSNTFLGTVDASGTVYGVGFSGSTFTITYTLPTGCLTTTVITIVSPPTAITGLNQVCEGSTITLFNGVAGGTWTSSNPAVAIVDPVTGVVTGIGPPVTGGVAIITYTMGGGSCYATYIITVNPLPAPITGVTSVCHGLTTSLFDATPGGFWSSIHPTVATIHASSGVVTGVSPGTALISYTLASGCASTTSVIVNPLPAPISGNKNVCIGGTRTLSDSPSPGTWSSANPAVATVELLTGVVHGVCNTCTGGTTAVTIITYTLASTGCIMTTTVAVHPLPVVYNVLGGGSYCSGGSGIELKLSNSEIGVNYLLYLGSAPVGTYAGTGLPLSFGFHLPGGTYTVVATNTFTTCSVAMTGSATIVVIPSVTPSVSINVNPNDTVCSGTAVNYTLTTANAGSSPTYQWSVNGTNVSTVSSYSFVPANGDIVRIQMTSNAICPSPAVVADTVIMTVNTPVVPSVGMLVSPNDTVCVGAPVTFTAIPSNGGTSPVYLWMVNSVYSGGGMTYTYTPTDGDLVYVRMKSNYMCRLADTVSGNIETITVDEHITPIVTITANPGTLIALGQSDTLTATVVNGGPAPTYQWFINGIPISGATNATYISNNFSNPSQDSISCLVTNSNFCQEKSFGWIYVEVHPVGVTQVTGKASDINVIPNPNKGIFIIKGSLGTINDEDVSVELTDMLGQVVYKENIKAKGGKIDKEIILGSTIANGMYMLNVRTAADKKVFHIVIEQ